MGDELNMLSGIKTSLKFDNNSSKSIKPLTLDFKLFARPIDRRYVAKVYGLNIVTDNNKIIAMKRL